MLKKILALCAAGVVLAASLPASELYGTMNAGEEAGAAAGTSDVTDVGSEMNFKSVNTVGDYVTQQLSIDSENKAREQEKYSGRYSIADVLYDPGSGRLNVVSTQTMDCIMKVRFVGDDENAEIAAKTESRVSKGENIITGFSIDPGALPEYYTIYVDMYDTLGCVQMCPTYIMSDFTEDMQKIYASTAEDFDEEYVVSLDGSTDTNFMVLSEEVVIADSSDDSNTLLSADYESGTYVFENADETLENLQEDDYFYIRPSENDIIAISVGSVESEGGVVTITDSGDEVDDMFDYVKIEASGDTNDMTMETPDCVTIMGTQSGDAFVQADAEAALSGTLAQVTLGIENSTGELQDKFPGLKYLNGEANLSMTVSLGITYSFNFYKSYDFVSVEAAVEVPFTFEMGVDGAVSLECPLATCGAPIAHVFEMELILSLCLELSGKASISFTKAPKVGFCYDSDNGLQGISEDAESNSKSTLSAEGTLFAGIKMEIEFSDLFDTLMEASIGFKSGPQLKGSISTDDYSSYRGALSNGITSYGNVSEDILHPCNSCVKGTAEWVHEVTVNLNLLPAIEALKAEFSRTIASYTLQLGDWYYSDVTGFGWGESCPNVAVKVQFNISKNEDGVVTPLEGARVNTGGRSYETDANGNVVLHAKKGLYYYTVSYEGASEDGTIAVEDKTRSINHQFTVTEDGVSVNSGAEETTAATTTTTAATGIRVTTSAHANPSHYTLESGQLGDNIYYLLYNDGYMMIYGHGAMKDFSRTPFSNTSKIKVVSIENSGSGGITNIGASLFRVCSELTLVEIPDTVTSIGSSAFNGCTSLPEIKLPSSVKTIGDHAFYNCKALSSFDIPDDISVIEEYTFAGCSALESISLHKNITTIGSYAFSGCSSLADITIADSITSIGDSAFSNCTSLTELVIPDSVNSMGTSMLNGSTSLESLSIPFAGTSRKYADTSDYNSVSQVSDLFSYYASVASSIDGDTYAIRNITVTGGKTIPPYAFNGLNMLESVVIPPTAEVLGSSAFQNCASLKGIKIPDSVVSMGDHVFDGCASFKAVPYGNNLTAMGAYAFANCTGLENVSIADTYTSIGSYAFSGCSSLADITIADSITSIGDSAFSNCTSLTELVIPDSVDSMGTSMLNGSTSLVSLTIPFAGTSREYADTSDYNSISQVSDLFSYYASVASSIDGKTYAIRNITVTGGKTIPPYAFNGMDMLTTITLPDSVTVLNNNAFSGCSGLTGITIPETVTVIKSNVFQDCTGMSSITIPGKCATIGSFAFTGCSGLKDINITEGVTVISDSAFSNCTSLTELVIPDSVTSMGTSMLNGSTSLESLSIPFAGTSREYADSGDYNSVCQVSDLFSYYANVASSIDGDTYAIRNITVTGGKTIPPYAFNGMNMLESVVIPPTAEVLGSSAFQNCASLKGIKIPDSVVSMGDHVFDGCASFKAVPYGNNLTAMGAYAFANCTGLENVSIADTYTSIGSYAFSGCSSLADITIADSITSIGDSAFSNCTSLTELVIPDSVDSMGTSMLNGSTSLVSLTIPFAGTSREYADTSDYNSISQVSDLFSYYASVASSIDGKTYAIRNITVTGGKTIPPYAFNGMDMLESVVIPADVSSIGNCAFNRCSSVDQISIENKECSISNNAETFAVDTALRGYTDSTAHTYAETFGRNFIAIDSSSPDVTTTTTTTDTSSTTTTTTVSGVSSTTDKSSSASGTADTTTSASKTTATTANTTTVTSKTTATTAKTTTVTSKTTATTAKTTTATTKTTATTAKTTTATTKTTATTAKTTTATSKTTATTAKTTTATSKTTATTANTTTATTKTTATTAKTTTATSKTTATTAKTTTATTKTTATTAESTTATTKTTATTAKSTSSTTHTTASSVTTTTASTIATTSVTPIVTASSASTEISTTAVSIEVTSDSTSATTNTDTDTTSVTSATVTSETTETVTVMTGDADNNSTVDLNDAASVLRYYACIGAGLDAMLGETEEAHFQLLRNADVNRDGMVTLNDASLILSYYAQTGAGLKITWDDLISSI